MLKYDNRERRDLTTNENDTSQFIAVQRLASKRKSQTMTTTAAATASSGGKLTHEAGEI
jgi:hypothetical protein